MSEWQPIKTMPDNGKQVIVWNGEEMQVLNMPIGCALGRWSKINGKWCGASVRFDKPTHWKSLPPPPKV